VKLENVFLCPRAPGAPLVKLIDFGIAKVLPTAPQGHAPAPLAFPTEEGVTIGTPRFLAPEQLGGRRVDARADIYGVGVVLYTLVAGRGPFDHAKTLRHILRAQALETPAAPSGVAPQPVAHALDVVILRALEKDPDARFQTAAGFVDALRSVVAEPMPVALPIRQPDLRTAVQRAREVAALPPVCPAAGRPAEPAPVAAVETPSAVRSDAPPRKNASKFPAKRHNRFAERALAVAIVTVAALVSMLLVALVLAALR
jgi:eukaryotic-like serine/threonine-protein kinase